MNRSILLGVSAAVLASAAASAAPVTGLSLGANRDLVQEKLVVASLPQVTDPTFKVGASPYSGVGGLIINTDSGDAAGFVSLCTASFIGARTLITAAHCLDDADVNRIRFRTGASNGLGGRPFSQEYEAASYWIHPDFVSVGGQDIAFIRLGYDQAARGGEEIYGVYGNTDEKDHIHTKVGFGTTGEGTAGTRGITPTGEDFFKRAGNNIYDSIGDEFFSDVGPDVLLFDFDSGLAINDVFGEADRRFCGGLELCWRHNTGVDRESNSSPGDSGGPTFIDGLIAGITSFGITGAIIDSPATCGPAGGGIDPDGNLPGPNTGGRCTNSSFGEISGDTRVSFYLDFVRLALANRLNFRELETPEPGMIGLFGLGLAGALVARRRRKA
jgi:hypothetical protein